MRIYNIILYTNMAVFQLTAFTSGVVPLEKQICYCMGGGNQQKVCTYMYAQASLQIDYSLIGKQTIYIQKIQGS